jgi:hypothetical protein
MRAHNHRRRGYHDHWRMRRIGTARRWWGQMEHIDGATGPDRNTHDGAGIGMVGVLGSMPRNRRMRRIEDGIGAAPGIGNGRTNRPVRMKLLRGGTFGAVVRPAL